MGRIDYYALKSLDDRFGTPFYIMHTEKYKENLNSFLSAFKRRYGKIVAGYSFKTNYVPALCIAAKEEGCYAEVVSEMEYELALKLGFSHIIFNGPIKRPAVLEKAIEQGAIVQLDSEYEVAFVLDYKKKHPEWNAKIGLRVNVGLTDKDGNSTIQCGLRSGRFGFPESILKNNIDKLNDGGIKIISIHGHTSSSDRAVLNYRIISEKLLEVCSTFLLNDLRYFDVGGGFFGAAPEGMDLTGRPSYEDYANVILNTCLKNEWFNRMQPTIVIEPGSSVVSNVFSYYTKVYQTKEIGTSNFVLVDGTVFDVKPTLHSNNLPYRAICAQPSNNSITCDVVGSTCMEKDIILKDIVLPVIHYGDYIEISGVGAYTIALTPSFINYLPPILVNNQQSYKEVRRRQRLDDILTIYTL